MIVAVESNFVLELAFRQDEAKECEQLLALAAEGAITLAIPGCSLFEPYETLGRRTKHREYISRLLKDEFAQLSRSEGLAELVDTSKVIGLLLAECGQVQLAELDSTIDKLSRAATVIPLTAEIARRALAIRLVYRLSSQDSMVVASVEKYMIEQGVDGKVFANKNRLDFTTALVKGHFESVGCRIIGDFSAAREFVQGSIAKASM